MHRGRGWRTEKRKVSPYKAGLGETMHLGEGIQVWEERWKIKQKDPEWNKEAQWKN